MRPAASKPVRFGLLFCWFVIFGAAEPVIAEQPDNIHPWLMETYTIDLGVFFPQRQVKIRFDTSAGFPGDIVNIESDFKAKKSDDLFSMNFAWRFGEKWQLGAQYFDSANAQSAVLNEDIQWGDVVFGVGSRVDGGQDFSMTRIFFARDFAAHNDREYGLGLGLHWIDIGAFLSGRILDENGDESAFRRQAVHASVPLPNIGAWYSRSLSPDWAFKSRIDWMSVSVGNYDGELINAAFGVNYRILDNAGIGLSYNYFDLDIDIKKAKWIGNWNTRYQGLYVYLSFFW